MKDDRLGFRIGDAPTPVEVIRVHQAVYEALSKDDKLKVLNDLRMWIGQELAALAISVEDHEMKTVKMTVELTYDETLMYANEEDSKAWFFAEILGADHPVLSLHSAEIGSEIGLVKVIELHEPTSGLLVEERLKSLLDALDLSIKNTDRLLDTAADGNKEGSS